MRAFSRITRTAIACALTAGAVLATPAIGKTLRYATGYPAGSDAAVAAENYAKAVKEYSKGDLTIRVFPMSLLSAAETSNGIRDKMADIGYLLTIYTPGEYPHTNLLNDASMQLLFLEKAAGREALAYAGALTEFTLFNCPECHKEFAAQNQVYTGGGSSSNYGLLCTTPVTTLDELKGKRIRIAGSHWARWVSSVGATPVSLTINEVYEALSQGVVDCNIQSAPELINLRLIDAVKAITIAVPGGVYAGVGSANVNTETWRSLNEQQRAAMLRGGAVMTAEVAWGYEESAVKALAEAKQRGISMLEPDAALLENSRNFAKADMKTIIDAYHNQYKVDPKRAEELLQQFAGTLEKWVELVQDVDTKEKLIEVYWDEIFSKLDVKTYGM